jgi:neutral trehalase
LWDEGNILNRYYDRSIRQDHQIVPQRFDRKNRVAGHLRDVSPFTLRAESGWDYSSRWFKTEKVSNNSTTDIAPVDLKLITLLPRNPATRSVRFGR